MENILLRCRPLQRTLWGSFRQHRVGFVRLNSTTTTASELTWAEYLNIRRGRRKWQWATTIPCTALGFFGGIAYFGSLDTDPTKPIMGLIDPFLFYGLCTLGCMGGGALVGTSLGLGIWRVMHNRTMNLIDGREREFYRRIAKNRVDASLQSPTSPVPDYYGEKIGSLHQYRQWLRDQNKYRRKVLFTEKA
ncbi:mitochondrial import protein Pam17 [Mycena floridula]|nr:mitochondrial import protein Pam17 [Mycena floridula]